MDLSRSNEPHSIVDSSSRDEAAISKSVFVGDSEMADVMRKLDWAQTPLGSVRSWSPALRMMVRFLLANRFPLLLWWGPQFCQLYNDAYRPILGQKHPQFVGRPVSECWSEIWHILEPLIRKPFEGGPSTWMEDIPLEINRHGFLEETHFTIAYSPVPDDTVPSGIGGVLATVHEISEKVVGERRTMALRDLGAGILEERTAEEACVRAAGVLAEYPKDVAFALLYLLDPERQVAHIAGSTGLEKNQDIAPSIIEISSPNAWPLSNALVTGRLDLVEALSRRFVSVPQGAWSDPPDCAAVIPLHSNVAHQLAGFLIAGISPRLRFDDLYRSFLELAASQIATAISNGHAYEEERRRAEVLVELDRTKTKFFSNVSHEFRTPLTLMLGPLEELLAKGSQRLGTEVHQQMEVAHRNALRLLKLVNTLLDFSRIEAGRVQAVYEPTNLAELTAEIASVFRSAMEKAGLRFSVKCEPIREPMYVDREMWEKIVLNLLSNAFKFTFEGEVALTLRSVNGTAELAVRDTGVGIAKEEQGRVFERFHRIESTRARTYEGTGIGLALVLELVRLHGGGVRVESTLGYGSTFTVSIPWGTAHLPEDRIGADRTQASTALSADAYVDEALRWLPQESGAVVEETATPPLPSAAATSTVSYAKKDVIVVADDNADMRDYLVHLLREQYAVHALADGAQAVSAIRQLRPALVLADVMMPELDGFGVLHTIRSDESLRNTPVILLSARAGEESRVEGLEAGADDYLVKPFTARELIARVATHVRMAKLRREAADREARLRAEAQLERHRLQELLAQAPAAIGLMSGLEHRWVYVNEEYVRLTGRKSPADFLGKTVLESLPEMASQVFIELLDEVYRTGKSYVGREMKLVLNRSAMGLPDESYWDFVYQPVGNAKGNVEGILVHAVEVTEKIAAQRASQHLAAIVESSDAAIISKDLNGIVTSWNPAAEKIFGYSAQEMVGRSITTIIPPELHDDERRILGTIRRGERIEYFETVRLTKSGKRIDVSLTISPVLDAAGRIIGAAKIARDVTQQKKDEQALRVTERLASVGRLAATVAHEINNPLEAVTNLVYLAKDRAVRKEVREFLDVAEEELDRISLLTKQTLGFYRETKCASPIRVGAIIASLISVFAGRVRNKGMKICPEVRDDPEIYAVPGEIRQLIANLLNNSIDAVNVGGRIRIRVSGSNTWDGQRPGVRLTIADSGPGIPLAVRTKLFEPFFTTKKEVGTGLGLWVCKSIVDKHGGLIHVRSSTVPGRSWTAFSVFLPADRNDVLGENLRQAV